ncbi:MAG: flagellar hook-basal body complex protein FliE [Deltaproteobacteria bacterium]|nr:flagellar hook-basal body complex protein FliE [Deltaproteobacteria bacterium]
MDVKDIVQLPQLAFLRAREVPAAAGGGEAHPFADVLKSSLDEVNTLQQKADAAITALATGDKMSLHDTMIAMEQADVSFRLMMQVRNKIVDAYQEIMRIQV